jgi:hypothetical protein
MANVAYINGRRKYQRPQAILLANNSGTIESVGGQSFYLPLGNEVGSEAWLADPTVQEQFIILSDDNRKPIDITPERIEKRERTINGRMRSYHIADKLKISTGWDMLPSRSAATPLGSDSVGATDLYQYTSDGGAGGVEILDWYENNPGSFWVYLAYDKYDNFSKDAAGYGNLGRYNEVVEVFFSDFQYSIQKRGGTNFDFWNISFSLEEA